MTFLAIGGAGLLLDALLGDPKWFPHPVRIIGRYCSWMEPRARMIFGDTRSAGAVTVVITVATTGIVAYALVFGLGVIHPVLGIAMEIAMAYFAISMRDLSDHAMAVKGALDEGSLGQARESAQMMVGRDTAGLAEQEIARAAVESVAENSVDGVIAPLFYIALGGAVGAMAYKAVSTMDSMFGYKNKRYIRFGWAAARLDDLLNFIPARLAALLIPLAALGMGQDAAGSWRIMRRDGSRHASPNSGLAEAAFAGALGVRLGGVNRYGAQEKNSPYIGDLLCGLGANSINKAVLLMIASSLLFFAFLMACNIFIQTFLTPLMI